MVSPAGENRIASLKTVFETAESELKNAKTNEQRSEIITKVQEKAKSLFKENKSLNRAEQKSLLREKSVDEFVSNNVDYLRIFGLFQKLSKEKSVKKVFDELEVENKLIKGASPENKEIYVMRAQHLIQEKLKIAQTNIPEYRQREVEISKALEALNPNQAKAEPAKQAPDKKTPPTKSRS